MQCMNLGNRIYVGSNEKDTDLKIDGSCGR